MQMQKSSIVTTIQRSRTIQTFCQNPILPPLYCSVHAMPMSDVQEHHQLESKYWVGEHLGLEVTFCPSLCTSKVKGLNTHYEGFQEGNMFRSILFL